jgi:hypothetical protein
MQSYAFECDLQEGKLIWLHAFHAQKHTCVHVCTCLPACPPACLPWSMCVLMHAMCARMHGAWWVWVCGWVCMCVYVRVCMCLFKVGPPLKNCASWPSQSRQLLQGFPIARQSLRTIWVLDMMYIPLTQACAHTHTHTHTCMHGLSNVKLARQQIPSVLLVSMVLLSLTADDKHPLIKDGKAE